MARILAVDYGLKRCGLAVTDPLKIIVNGLTTVKESELLDFILNYCQENTVECIVIGYPLQADGSKTPIGLKIDQFCAVLNKLLPELTVTYTGERGSSKDAMKFLVEGGTTKKKRGNKELLDKMSAVVILQRYLGHI